MERNDACDSFAIQERKEREKVRVCVSVCMSEKTVQYVTRL